MALPSRPLQEPSLPCPEAGFSLVEVLAALTIAALTLGMVMQVFSGAARLGHRLEMQTAARMLARAVLADSTSTSTSTSGTTGQFHWQVKRDTTGARQLWIDWANGAGLTLTRMDAAPAITDATP